LRSSGWPVFPGPSSPWTTMRSKTVVYKNQQAGKQRGEKFHRSSVLRSCLDNSIIGQTTGGIKSSKLAIHLTQVGAVGRSWWGGRPRPRGGPCLRFRQRDEDVPCGPGGPPHQSRRQSDYLSQVDSPHFKYVWLGFS
jgi:hypothetical protein